MRRLETMLNINRRKLLGRVEGLGIQTYEGPCNSVVIDGDGLAILLKSLGLGDLKAVPA